MRTHLQHAFVRFGRFHALAALCTHVGIVLLLASAATAQQDDDPLSKTPKPTSGATASAFEGVFAEGDLVVSLRRDGDAYQGTLENGGKSAKLAARIKEDALEGEYLLAKSSVPFTATLADDILALKVKGTVYQLRRQYRLPDAAGYPDVDLDFSVFQGAGREFRIADAELVKDGDTLRVRWTMIATADVPYGGGGIDSLYITRSTISLTLGGFDPENKEHRRRASTLRDAYYLAHFQKKTGDSFVKLAQGWITFTSADGKSEPARTVTKGTKLMATLTLPEKDVMAIVRRIKIY